MKCNASVGLEGILEHDIVAGYEHHAKLCLGMQVLVMEDGRVKEYDSPSNLMQIPNGTFRAMVVEAGLSDDSATSALQ